nr:egg cell-secreted protein 1.3-like isoform X3 [Ziziphus jujuba var. spinosa]
MSSKSQALLVALTWMVMLVQTGLAQLPPQPSQPDSVLGIPGLFPPGTPKEVLQCWSSLTDTRGCVVAIFSSILSLNFGNIGQACCESFVKISSDCWPKMFPLNPLFAPLLNSTCAALIGK